MNYRSEETVKAINEANKEVVSISINKGATVIDGRISKVITLDTRNDLYGFISGIESAKIKIDHTPRAAKAILKKIKELGFTVSIIEEVPCPAGRPCLLIIAVISKTTKKECKYRNCKNAVDGNKKYCCENCQWREGMFRKDEVKVHGPVKKRNGSYFWMCTGKRIARGQGRRVNGLVLGAMSVGHFNTFELVKLTFENALTHYKNGAEIVVLGNKLRLNREEVFKALILLNDEVPSQSVKDKINTKFAA